MRCAILELGFRGLGADVAESGAAEGNAASARVSAKLGYRDAGEGTVSPRGEPIRHFKYELDAAGWQAPLAVEITGLEPCLPLFGL
jgi:RimJ/RimL family protein N-acetyltransferase